MTERSWTTRDKRDWGPGEWRREPDKIQWIDEETGLDCLIHRGPSGALCGYVGVPSDHPAYGVDYEKPAVDVHGGLTYADKCQDRDDESTGVCHVPEPGRPHDVWWLGFDCAHSGDYCPAHIYGWTKDETYRNVAYVRSEVASLARQLRSGVSVASEENEDR